MANTLVNGVKEIALKYRILKRELLDARQDGVRRQALQQAIQEANALIARVSAEKKATRSLKKGYSSEVHDGEYFRELGL